jgi:hypothetical protein
MWGYTLQKMAKIALRLFTALALFVVLQSDTYAAMNQIRRTVTRSVLCTEGKTVGVTYHVLSVGAPGRIMHYLSGTNVKPGTAVKVHMLGRTIGVNGRIVTLSYLVKAGEVVNRSTLTGSDYSVVWYRVWCW